MSVRYDYCRSRVSALGFVLNVALAARVKRASLLLRSPPRRWIIGDGARPITFEGSAASLAGARSAPSAAVVSATLGSARKAREHAVLLPPPLRGTGPARPPSLPRSPHASPGDVVAGARRRHPSPRRLCRRRCMARPHRRRHQRRGRRTSVVPDFGLSPTDRGRSQACAIRSALSRPAGGPSIPAPAAADPGRI